MPTKPCIPTETEIRARAYQIYMERSCGHDHASADWLQAEYELMHLPLHKLAQLDAAAIEKQTAPHLRLIDVAHAVPTLNRQSRKPAQPLWNYPAIGSTAVAA